MKTFLLIAALISLLIGSLVVALIMWLNVGEVEISFHGFLAMGLGIFVTLALGIGLMALVFFSNRRGYDDRANR